MSAVIPVRVIAKDIQLGRYAMLDVDSSEEWKVGEIKTRNYCFRRSDFQVHSVHPGFLSPYDTQCLYEQLRTLNNSL